ncbi:MAG: RNA 2',3'-cyclic phosphodiesterase, partial [Acidobacteria bacterium]
GATELVLLAAQVDAALGGVGIPKERRPFSAHATLGRVRSPRNTDALLAAIAAEPDGDFGRVPVQEFLLIRSQLSPQGSTYTVVERWPLKT